MKFAFSAMVLTAVYVSPCAAEQIVCPQASPFQGFQLGAVTWNFEYSSLFLRRVQIRPTFKGALIFCEKLYGLVSTEIAGDCEFQAGEGQIATEPETNTAVCSMPPVEKEMTNREHCLVFCTRSAKPNVNVYDAIADAPPQYYR
jgi:hypothetical protein